MKIMVFGVTGWVGHSIARIFSADGACVTVCSRGKNAGFAANLPEAVRILRADNIYSFPPASSQRNAGYWRGGRLRECLLINGKMPC